jgi:hypothetical protein
MNATKMSMAYCKAAEKNTPVFPGAGCAARPTSPTACKMPASATAGSSWARASVNQLVMVPHQPAGG